MKQTLVLAIAPLFLAAACASTGGNSGTAPTASASMSGAQYCKKDRLETAGDAYVCNWSSSTAEACETNNLVTMKKSAVAGAPAGAGRCGNGQWLVSVTTK